MFETVIEAMVDAVLVVDAQGTVIAANSAAAQLTGHAREALVGMPYGRLLLDESSGVRTEARRARGSGPQPQQSWLLTTSGERVPVSLTGPRVMVMRRTRS